MTDAVRAAREVLGIDRLALSIHDPSFPSDDAEETGRGTPYGTGAERFLAAIAKMGFDTLQLGPQGLTHPDNPSPYDGAIFARNVASISLARLDLADSERAALIAELPADRSRADHRRNRAIVERALAAIDVAGRGELSGFYDNNAGWLERDALFEILAGVHGTSDVRAWPGIDQTLWQTNDPPRLERRRDLQASSGAAIDRFVLQQAIAHDQHAALRRRCAAIGVELAGDLQIGMAPRDAWSYAWLFWPDYKMGAPPSRTNREGQAWGYPIFSPELARRGGPARELVRARLAKLFREYDAVRIDHPHGWVCPWVYRADHPDPHVAVQQGARLWSSPDLPDHPALAPLSIARPDQLDRDVPRHDDRWVRALEPAQIDAYAELFDELVSCAGDPEQLICEVLSTQPRPLAEVMRRHGLGRWRVTQKADLDEPADVYRSENAEPADWIMVGNHDTASIWELVGCWQRDGSLEAQAHHLAHVLAPAAGGSIAGWLAGSPGRIAVAKIAEIFASRARHAMIFFADLFGVSERYNKPGTVGDHNWTVRVPPDWESRYPGDCEADRAVSIPAAMALALRARGGDEAERIADRLWPRRI
jgi:4-alpha-glucanotransferase